MKGDQIQYTVAVDDTSATRAQCRYPLYLCISHMPHRDTSEICARFLFFATGVFRRIKPLCRHTFDGLAHKSAAGDLRLLICNLFTVWCAIICGYA